MNPRATTMRAMVGALQALDNRARFHADFARGVADGLAALGVTNDHVEAMIAHDRGEWLIDRDGRRVWRVIP